MAEIDWLARRLRNAGLKVREVDGWHHRGRPPSTGAFRPRGVLIHHTAVRSSRSDPHPALQTVIRGRSDLPGPLCHVLIDRNGVCWVIAAGRANHAGTARRSGPMPAGDGNTLYVGIEIDYHPDYQAVSRAQRKSAKLAAAAIVTKLGHRKGFVRAHKETCIPPGRKIDPSNFGISMNEFRDRVGNVIRRKYLLQSGEWREEA